jgi:3-oxoacyl-[acyl-carrier protein] reductase
MMANSLRGRTALVTGGSRGIGAAISRALAEAGAAVAINYRARTDEANKLAEDLRKTGVHVTTVQADVSLAEAVSKMVDSAKSELGTIDILINNAGIAITRGIDDLSEADFDRTIATNLKSVFLCTQGVLPMMRAKKWGRIVNISSGAARGAGAIGPHYNASKAGVEGLTRGYAARLVKEGITVNAVAPSLIETEMMKGQENLVSRIPLGRFGKADEVARAVMMLVDNPYMTGQTVAMSGGMTFN